MFLDHLFDFHTIRPASLPQIFTRDLRLLGEIPGHGGAVCVHTVALVTWRNIPRVYGAGGEIHFLEPGNGFGG